MWQNQLSNRPYDKRQRTQECTVPARTSPSIDLLRSSVRAKPNFQVDKINHNNNSMYYNFILLIILQYLIVILKQVIQ